MITVFVYIGVLATIIAIALKGWQRTGLVSIGFSTTLGIGVWNTFARLPNTASIPTRIQFWYEASNSYSMGLIINTLEKKPAGSV